LWGLIGILLAGPLLACFRIICQHTEALRPVYVLIGEAKFDETDERAPANNDQREEEPESAPKQK
jgi:predicted PurR-regulated permease PerM